MMEWADRHCRFFHRLMTWRALLYTEMVTTGAVLHGERAELIGFDPFEHPVALQLGGSHPRALARCARIAQDLGYDEINLNVGCPSDRVQQGRFSGCLMAEPDHVGASLPPWFSGSSQLRPDPRLCQLRTWQKQVDSLKVATIAVRGGIEL
jgi:tRNA-dihydrouridine synthase A